MNRHALIVLICLFPALSHGQFNWLRSEGGQGNDEALSVVADSSGHSLTCGYISGTASFGSQTVYTNGLSDVYVAKYDSTGVLDWITTAGGSANDRATALCTDASGNIYVTGYFTAAAVFGTSTLNALGSNRDVFVAKLTADGTFLWAISLGGNLEDEATAIATDGNGYIWITGYFRGTGVFGSEVLSSTVNPETELPGRDTFLSKIASDGSVLWTRQALCSKNDQGNDVTTDTDGQAIVIGQFSGDITFDLVHPNSGNYASYLVVFSSEGEEIQFIRALGAYLSLEQVKILTNGNRLIGGNVSGYATFLTSPPQSIATSSTHSLFLCEMDENGIIQWYASDGSENEVNLISIDIGPDQAIYVAGTFTCTFDALAADFGSGSFNSVGFRDIFVARYSETGVRQWQRQFAGKSDDWVNGIAAYYPDKPVIAGSYSGFFNVPYHPSFLNGDGTIKNVNQFSYSCEESDDCTDSHLRSFLQVAAIGLRDAFITSPVNLDRLPYYYYREPVINCLLDQPTLNLYEPGEPSCLSSSLANNYSSCTTGLNSSPWQFVSYQSDFNILPTYSFSWSPGIYYNSSLNGASVSESGTYWLTIASADGCYLDTDTLDVTLYNPPPIPLITDDAGINYLANPADPIVLCNDDSVQLTITAPPQFETWWFPLNDTAIYDSVVTATSSGYYYAYVSNDTCNQATPVSVQLNDNAFPDLNMGVAFPSLFFFDPLLYAPTQLLTEDTVLTCPSINTVIAFFYENDGQPPFNLYTGISSVYMHITIGGVLLIDDTLGSPFIQLPNNFGDLDITMQAFYECEGVESVSGIFHQFIHFEIAPQIILASSGTLCPGGTLLLTASGYEDYVWHGPGANSTAGIYEVLSPDSVLIDLPGIYYVQALGEGAANSCTTATSGYIVVNEQPLPVATVNPSSGIVCPGGTVQLNCTGSGTHLWYTIDGDFAGTGISLQVSAPGYYHCQFTASNGCTVYSNIILVQEYFPPGISAVPQEEICEGLSTFVVAEVPSSSFLLWQFPLSGNNPVQEITNAGTYSYIQNLCGNVDTVSIVIGEITAPANIYLVNTLCAGDSSLLTANPDMMSYYWTPSGSTNDSVYVSSADSVQLQTLDYFGCAGESEWLQLTAIDFQPVIDAPFIACDGNLVDITVNYPDSIAWYADEALTQFLGSDSVLVITMTGDSITLWLAETYPECTFPPLPVTVFTSELPDMTTWGDPSLCTGEDLELIANGDAGVNYAWTDPGGLTTTGEAIEVLNVQEVDSGSYLLVASDSLCSDSIHVEVVIYPLPEIVLSPNGNTAFCEGQNVEASVSGNAQIWQWIVNGELFNTTETTLALDDAGIYQVVGISAAGCTSFSETLTIDLWPLPPEPSVGSRYVCEGDSVGLVAQGEGIFTWYVDPPEVYATGDSVLFYHVVEDIPVFVQATSEEGCSSPYTEIAVLAIRCDGLLANVFTPNGDGLNDSLDFDVFEAPAEKVELFDRWGRRIKQLDPPFTWDGSDDSGKAVIEGTYYYILHLLNGRNSEGYVLVVR